ncbi:MAG TPA: hypothetical protein VEB21_17465, partial [Terriglobales bacterium]|nr:hypothetical protein [Terriglobales bacterium]
MRDVAASRRCGAPLWILLWLCAGCAVGPEYRRRDAPTAELWRESADTRVTAQARVAPGWWRELDDPALDRLIATAHRQNLNLQIAGLRVVEAQARRGIAVGGLFPQTQSVSGAFSRRRLSLNTATQLGDRSIDSYS